MAGDSSQPGPVPVGSTDRSVTQGFKPQRIADERLRHHALPIPSSPPHPRRLFFVAKPQFEQKHATTVAVSANSRRLAARDGLAISNAAASSSSRGCQPTVVASQRPEPGTGGIEGGMIVNSAAINRRNREPEAEAAVRGSRALGSLVPWVGTHGETILPHSRLGKALLAVFAAGHHAAPALSIMSRLLKLSPSNRLIADVRPPPKTRTDLLRRMMPTSDRLPIVRFNTLRSISPTAFRSRSVKTQFVLCFSRTSISANPSRFCPLFQARRRPRQRR